MSGISFSNIIASLAAASGLSGLPLPELRRYSMVSQNRRGRRKRAKARAAQRTPRHNPAGTKLARKARDGRLTINMRGW